MKWYFYYDDEYTTFPEEEGYYWVILKVPERSLKDQFANDPPEVRLAFWEGDTLGWYMGDFNIEKQVRVWCKADLEPPALPNYGDILWDVG